MVCWVFLPEGLVSWRQYLYVLSRRGKTKAKFNIKWQRRGCVGTPWQPLSLSIQSGSNLSRASLGVQTWWSQAFSDLTKTASPLAFTVMELCLFHLTCLQHRKWLLHSGFLATITGLVLVHPLFHDTEKLVQVWEWDGNNSSRLGPLEPLRAFGATMLLFEG